jgi:hypothetical protein
MDRRAYLAALAALAAAGCQSTVEIVETDPGAETTEPEPGGASHLYPATRPSLEQGYFTTFKIVPAAIDPTVAAITALDDGRFIIAWATETSTTVSWSVGTRDSWSLPVEAPGLPPLLGGIDRLDLFNHRGHLTLQVQADENLIAEGTFEGLTPVAYVPSGMTAQHPQGDVYFLGPWTAPSLQRIANGVFETTGGIPSDLPFPSSCLALDNFAFRSDGALLLVASCPQGTEDRAVATYLNGTWSAPIFVDARELSPRNGTSPVIGALVDLSTENGTDMGYAQMSDGIVRDLPHWHLEVDPWGRPFLPGGNSAYYSEDGGVTWLLPQTFPDDKTAHVTVGAFEVGTGRPVFTDGEYVIWWEPTPGSTWP